MATNNKSGGDTPTPGGPRGHQPSGTSKPQGGHQPTSGHGDQGTGTPPNSGGSGKK